MVNIINKNVTRAKITIAGDGIRIKFPLEYSEAQKNFALEVFNDLIEKFPYQGQTMRGSITNIGVFLRYNDNSIVDGSTKMFDINK